MEVDGVVVVVVEEEEEGEEEGVAQVLWVGV